MEHPGTSIMIITQKSAILFNSHGFRLHAPFEATRWISDTFLSYLNWRIDLHFLIWNR